MAHKPDKWCIVHRFNQENVVQAIKYFIYRLLNIRVKMNRINKISIRM